MTEIKSHEFDGFLQRTWQAYRVFVIYGPDRGLVSERASQIAARTGIPLDDPFSLVRLDASDLQQNSGRLADEINTVGLFGGEKLVWMRAAGSEKALVDALDLFARVPPEGSYLLIEAGEIKKAAGIRKIADSASAIASIACYGDDARAVNALIDQELGSEGLRITPAARQLLQESLGGDRLASRNEIRKLALYCRGFDMVTEEHVSDAIGDASAISVDDAIDAVLKGDSDQLHQAIRKIVASKTAIFLVLQSCLKQFQLLDSMRAEMDDKRMSSSQVIATAGRHLHFRRKPLVEAALKQWTASAIQRELARLQAAIFQTRSRPALEDSIALQTLLAITLQSARR